MIGVVTTHGARGQSDGDELQFEIDCLAWQHETPRQRSLDGPKFRDSCLQYLSSRSPKQVAHDEAFEQKILKAAQKEWDEYEKKHDPTGALERDPDNQ